MKIGVFDVDDTLIIHGSGSQNYYNNNNNNNLRELLQSKGFDRIYLYTNGTYGHGLNISEHLNISDMVSFIYGRDNLRPALYPPRHMKPYQESFNFVNESIQSDSGSFDNDVYFFDDLKENLQTAKNIGWKTILIKSNETLKPYIDYVFTNIYSALLNLDL